MTFQDTLKIWLVPLAALVAIGLYVLTPVRDSAERNVHRDTAKADDTPLIPVELKALTKSEAGGWQPLANSDNIPVGSVIFLQIASPQNAQVGLVVSKDDAGPVQDINVHFFQPAGAPSVIRDETQWFAFHWDHAYKLVRICAVAVEKNYTLQKVLNNPPHWHDMPPNACVVLEGDL